MPESIDIAVVGAGAAGLMAAIWAGRASRDLRIVAFDGNKRLGIKILVAGGGRCNVTHHEVTADAFAGGSRNAIKKVLRSFGVDRTVGFFDELGVTLKREETGKLFPTTDDAHSVLDALLGAAHDARVELRHPARIDRIAHADGRFELSGDWGEVSAERVILATGGKALPKSGSDGGGYELAKALGHTITQRVFPALVPLVLDASCVLRELGGITLDARVELRSSTGKRLREFTNSVLCTHFGLSGPGVMDMSRYLTGARFDDPGAHLVMCWLPQESRERAEQELVGLGKRSVGRWVRDKLPERLALAISHEAGIDPTTTGASLTRDARRALLNALFEMRLPVTGDRGYTHAEVTGGGVPLDEISVSTMASRRCEGLYLCGEICDVDGRIGGFNFQWAWASGYLAGTNAARSFA